MKILLITYAFLPDIGGAEAVAYDYANLLVEQGHKVTVLSKEYSDSIKNTTFEYLQVPNRFGKHLWMFNYGFYFHRMNLIQYDCILLNQCPSPVMAGAFFSKAVLKKTVPIIQGLEVEYIYRNKDLLGSVIHAFLRIKHFHKKCLLNSRKIVSVSNFHKEKVIKAAKLGNIADKFQVVYTGIDKKLFKPIKSDFREIYHLHDKEILITAARIERMKGFAEMLDIFKSLISINTNYVWIIIGDGPYLYELKSRIQQYNLTDFVLILGRKQRNELSGYYSVADCFWLLSNYDECLPLVYLEAQACGTPAIGRNKGGVVETIQDRKTGFLINTSKECRDILLTKSYKNIRKEDMDIFVNSFDKIRATEQLIS